MAITKTVTLRNGLVAENAYIRIDAFYGSKAAISFSVNTYLSEAAFKGTDADAPAPFLEQEMLEFVPDTGPGALQLWQQCYGHLLAQKQYADAQNC